MTTMATVTARKPKRGMPVPENWRERFVSAYSESGLRWLSASKAGVSEVTVAQYESQEPAFALRVEQARQCYADGLEGNMHRLATEKNNVIANIVLLKKHRPQDYIERRQELHLHAHATVSDNEARMLLSAMLDQSTPATRAALAPVQPLHSVVEVGGSTTLAEHGILSENAAHEGTSEGTGP